MSCAELLQVAATFGRGCYSDEQARFDTIFCNCWLIARLATPAVHSGLRGFGQVFRARARRILISRGLHMHLNITLISLSHTPQPPSPRHIHTHTRALALSHIHFSTLEIEKVQRTHFCHGHFPAQLQTRTSLARERSDPFSSLSVCQQECRITKTSLDSPVRKCQCALTLAQNPASIIRGPAGGGGRLQCRAAVVGPCVWGGTEREQGFLPFV